MRLNGNRKCRLSGQEHVYCSITKLTLLAERGSAVAWIVLAEEAQVCGSCSCLQRRSLAAGTLKAWESLSVLCCKAPMFRAPPAFLLCSRDADGKEELRVLCLPFSDVPRPTPTPGLCQEDSSVRSQFASDPHNMFRGREQTHGGGGVTEHSTVRNHQRGLLSTAVTQMPRLARCPEVKSGGWPSLLLSAVHAVIPGLKPWESPTFP